LTQNQVSSGRAGSSPVTAIKKQEIGKREKGFAEMQGSFFCCMEKSWGKEIGIRE